MTAEQDLEDRQWIISSIAIASENVDYACDDLTEGNLAGVRDKLKFAAKKIGDAERARDRYNTRNPDYPLVL